MARRQRFRTPQSYARRGPSRERYDTVLLVCEGEKTEPYYFQGVQKHYGLSSANIEIMPAGGDPLSIVRRAIEKLDSAADLDRAYCVFDQDGHATYKQAMRLLTEHPHYGAGRLFAANSVPCFEAWLILHFSYSTAPITATGGRSAGMEAAAQLRGHWPGYAKGLAGAFEMLAPMLKTALGNARKLAIHNEESESSNPATNVHELVEYLRQLKG